MTTIEAGDRQIEITHEDRVIFPDAGITKADVIDYYQRAADYIRPHLFGRPLVMKRFPDGLGSDAFFQKQAPSHFPDWITSVELTRRTGGTVEHVVVCDEMATLLYVVNQGAFELHTLLAPADHADHPDQLIIDLDPSTDDVGPVIEAARAARALLSEVEVIAFVKSTGSRGVHIHVMLDEATDVDDVRATAKRMAERIVDRDPELFTIAQSKRDRGDRVFIDYLRNSYAQHAVVPYSVRARPSAPIALPMDWDEVTASSFDPQAFGVNNAFQRLSRKRDPWAGIDEVRYSSPELRDRLDRGGP